MVHVIVQDSFTALEQIEAFMAEFGVVLRKHPPLPVTVPGFLQFLRDENIPQPIVQRCVEHIMRGGDLYNPQGRPHPRSHIWPATPSALAEELFWSRTDKFIDRSTPIASMGSCFAVEIAYWLQKNGYNYVVTEPSATDPIQKASARWGLIYSSANVKQVIEWAFGEDRPPLVACPDGEGLRQGAVHRDAWVDLFRCDLAYNEVGLANMQKTWDRHLQRSRAALESCEVLVITVGLNEVFRWLPTGHYTHRAPHRVNPALWREEILTVQQNVDFLASAVATLRKYNPKVRIIATVSPVPLLKTFRRDTHVVCATAHAKSVLRVALDELARTVRDFHYMGSYETVMYPGTTTAVWEEDARHVDRETIGKVMRLFQAQFCVETA